MFGNFRKIRAGIGLKNGILVSEADYSVISVDFCSLNYTKSSFCIIGSMAQDLAKMVLFFLFFCFSFLFTCFVLGF